MRGGGALVIRPDTPADFDWTAERWLLDGREVEKENAALAESAVREIVHRSLGFYEEQQETLDIEVNIQKDAGLEVQGNAMLTEILVQNLLKNAFLHNVRHGKVSILIRENKLTIANTGVPTEEGTPTLDVEKLFNRFYKQSGNPDTWGLGLAIARKIAAISGWQLDYRKEDGLHTFEVLFR